MTLGSVRPRPDPTLLLALVESDRRGEVTKTLGGAAASLSLGGVAALAGTGPPS